MLFQQEQPQPAGGAAAPPVAQALPVQGGGAAGMPVVQATPIILGLQLNVGDEDVARLSQASRHRRPKAPRRARLQRASLVQHARVPGPALLRPRICLATHPARPPSRVAQPKFLAAADQYHQGARALLLLAPLQTLFRARTAARVREEPRERTSALGLVPSEPRRHLRRRIKNATLLLATRPSDPPSPSPPATRDDAATVRPPTARGVNHHIGLGSFG